MARLIELSYRCNVCRRCAQTCPIGVDNALLARERYDQPGEVFDGRATHLMRLCDAVIPAAASLFAIWAVATYPITEEKAHEIRKKLEARRGAV